MYKYLILFVVAILHCGLCLPLEETHSETHSESSSSSRLHLVMNNSSQSTNYHLTPVMSELQNIDQEIDDQLKAILPYLNFFFDTLLGQPKAADDDDCTNDMVIELIPDESDLPTKEAQSDKKSEDVPEANPDTANTKGNQEDKTDDNSTPKPDVVPTP